MSNIYVFAFCEVPAIYLKSKIMYINEKEIKPYKLAFLNDRGGDLSKRWYIEFWAWSVDKGKKTRKRLFKVNQFKTPYERRNYAKGVIERVNKDILLGKVFDKKKDHEQKFEQYVLKGRIRIPIEEDIFNIYKKTENSRRKKSNEQKRTVIKRFLRYKEKYLPEHTTIKDITKEIASNFQAFLLNDMKLANATVNKSISELKGYFKEFVKLEKLDKNPFIYVDSLPTKKSRRNIGFTEDEIQILKTEILKENKDLWNFIQFILFCYLRPKEIRQLKVKHLLLDSKRIFVPAEISKNKKGDYLVLSNILIDTIKDMDLNFENSESYLFTRVTSKHLPLSENYMYNQFRKILKNLGWLNKGFTLYSWKHTGVVLAYNYNIDIKSIQRQCRHSDISMTDNYLKTLGFHENTGFESKINNIKI